MAIEWSNEQKHVITERKPNCYLVSAGAGSGKTAVLSERIYQLVKEGTPIESFLVLTFTTLAASQMKSRIKEKILADESTRHLAPKVDEAHIETFDAFALYIVKRFHYLLGLSRDVNIIDNSILDIHKNKILDEILEEFAANDVIFQETIERYCVKNLSNVKELILKIKDADKAYFVDDNPIMTDKEYDEMVEKLKALELETRIVFSGSPSKKVAGGVKKELKEVKHTKPMLSAQKTKSLEEINRFVADKDAVVSWKLDGLTIVLRYQGGFLTQAITRGRDGLVGEDVTASVRYFRNVPKRIKETRTIEVRGEGVLSWKDHKILTGDNEEASNHPRHVAAGLTRTVEPDKGRTSHIDFFAFDLIDAPCIPNSKGGQFKYMAQLGFAVVPYEYYGSASYKTLEQVIETFNPKDFYYPADGLIFEYEDSEYGKSLGATEHHERRLMALKWEDEEYETKFTGVELITTKTGVII